MNSLRLVDPGSGTRQWPAVCADCGQFLTFFSEHRYGRSMQECACGVRALQPHRDALVHIPASMIAEESAMPFARVRKKCAVCRVWFIARAHAGAEVCSQVCRGEQARRHT